MRSHWKSAGLLALALASAPAWAEVTATEAWVRSTIGNQKATAAFLKLRSSEDAKLVGAAKLEMEHFFECVIQNKEPLVSGLDGRKALEVMLAVEKSIAEERIIPLPL